MRILVVDDHVDTLRAFRRLLTRHGHVITTAESLAEAKAHCERGEFDLILSDLQLPDGDGHELAEMAADCHVRVIAVSGLDQADAGARADGFWAYVVKPVSFERVLELLRLAETEIAAASGSTGGGI